MAGCERCWNEAGIRAMSRMGDKVEIYHEILADRDRRGLVCTPEEQCGDLHVVLEWKDGSTRCMCGKRRELPALTGDLDECRR